MRYFIGVVQKDPDSAYGIEFPDVPGCFSAADDLDDLSRNASEALAFWFEDAPMAEPRDLDALRQDPDVAQAMASGAFLLAVPLIAMTGRTVKANVTLDAGLLKAIDAVAKSRRVTRSALIADALRRELV
ncbi:type II toxin-antitoxin system HicB family antitoxin [Oceanicaulis sp.]|uniref:type II toxin-antitoxin system HicB family antitoxin n=1 Tax=Oceanicaulis sp. TaxID=1924941 RepID=UPI003BAAAEA7